MIRKKIKASLKPLAEFVFKIPGLGYLARMGIAFLRLPRFSERLWRLEHNHGILSARVDEIEVRTNAWNRHVPAFLNAVSTVGAFGHDLVEQRREAERLSGELGQVRNRLEFVRCEALFEQRYNQTHERTTNALLPKKIQNQEKFSAAHLAGMRLNIGCGHVPLEGFINVDMRDLPGVDVVAPINDMPIEENSLLQIFSGHVLEHFPQEELSRKLLPYWFSLLKSGGEFRAVVPDAKAMIAKYAAGEYVFEEFREVFFGLQEYEGDFHYNMFTPESLSALLTAASFINVSVIAEGRRNGKCYEFEISAQRP